MSACGLGIASKGTPANGGNAVNNDTAGGKTASAPAAAPPVGGDAQTTVANALQLRQSQPAYQVHTTATSSMGGKPTTDLREYVAPDRIHTVSNGKEMIIIGKVMYVKKGGEWQNMGTQMSDMTEKMKKGVENMRPEDKANALKGLTADYKSLGDEMLDGTATATYELDSTMDTHVQGIGSITTITKYWIGKSDGLILKEETNGEEAGIKVKSTKIYEYDTNIKIEAPM